MNKNGVGNFSGLVAFASCTALVACLLLPKIARQREAARSQACMNNLKQLGLGLHNYHSAYKQLPPGTGGTTGNPAPEKSNAGRLGPLVGLTPFVEQQPLWEMISNPYTDPDSGAEFPPMGPVPWYSAKKYAPWGMSPNFYLCPDNDPAPATAEEPKIRYTLAPEFELGSLTSYVSCYGDGTLLQAEQKFADNDTLQRRRAANRGIFVPATVIKFRDVLDGLSNTIMFSEVVASRRPLKGKNEVARDVKGIAKNPSLCLSAASDPETKFWIFGRGALWSDGLVTISGFQTVLPPNSPSCTSELGIEEPIASASSRHAGGVFVLLADGAVRFAADTIDTGDLTEPGVADQPGFTLPGSKSPYGVWGALGSRASKEVIDGNSFEPISNLGAVASRGPSAGPNLRRWKDKSGKISLNAEWVQIIDQKTIQLRATNGTIHEVPLNTLSDEDIFYAVKKDLLQKQE